ncbi:MAG: mechanosensitive ion channel [Erysipelotrichaceae bacterium]|nr:mechanosensitive ion channel [Erysipelotrichaceae bacterium]
MKNRKYLIGKTLVDFALIIAGMLIMYGILSNMQYQSTMNQQKTACEEVLDTVVATLEDNSQEEAQLVEIYNQNHQQTLTDIKYLLTDGLMDDLVNKTNEERTAEWSSLIERAGVQYLFVIDSKGVMMITPDELLNGRSLIDIDFFTPEQVDTLINGTNNEPVHATNDFGDYYFYSSSVEFQGTNYYLITGADTKILETEFATLTDIAGLIENTTVGQDGFLFAVDKSTGKYIYFNHGDLILSDTDYLESGLSDKALEDGYSGVEKISGIDFYCVSRSFDDYAIISAAMENATLYGINSTTITVAILCLGLAMIISLSYSMIVRNDYMLKNIERDKFTLYKSDDFEIFFDKTVALKIMPLIIACAIIIATVTYYSQTMMSLSNAVTSSDAALNGFNYAYEEAQLKRDEIKTYYDNQYISKAKLLAYYLEENPSVLNEKTNKTYFEYDENGNKNQILDDEGNPLKSVTESSSLKNLCKDNGIDAIYVFDESGRTIATSTSNWFFTLSLNEEDQSYVFRNVCDGVLDEYAQESMMDDQGNYNKYIGVTFSYYTSTDDNGNTVYVSSYDYKKYLEGTYSGNTITPHTSLLQICVDSTLMNTILSTTDVTYVLDNDVNLSGGYLLAFDTSEDHNVVYSPVASSIGRKAADINISDKAFSGLYNGFQKVNGIDYFQSYHDFDSYFIATAIPTSNIYGSRLQLTLATEIVCFIFLVLLSAITTVSNTKEEDMYEELLSKTSFSDSGINVRILSPSGKEKNTLSARSRWTNMGIPWNQKTPEQKLFTIVNVLLGIVTIYIIMMFIGLRTKLPSDSLVLFIISGQWDRALNVFALTACVGVIVMMVTAMSIINLIINLFTNVLGPKSETIGHLILSVVKYGCTIFCFFYCLYLLGMDASSLIASAGILSLVIGLGAQSLISDIIAGIFIVFEGEFRVGDIVTVDNFRGTVMDIGLRTTKVINTDNYVKILSNSKIGNIINMTRDLSRATVKLDLAADVDIDYVEKILDEKLPEIGKNIEGAVGDPVFVGVTAINPKSITIMVRCSCKELHINWVTRELNKELLKLLKENNIARP